MAKVTQKLLQKYPRATKSRLKNDPKVEVTSRPPKTPPMMRKTWQSSETIDDVFAKVVVVLDDADVDVAFVTVVVAVAEFCGVRRSFDF